jgi:predicted permease
MAQWRQICHHHVRIGARLTFTCMQVDAARPHGAVCIPGEDQVTNLILLMACLLAGVALRHSGRVGTQGHLPLNAVIVHIALPAVALRSLHTMAFDSSQVWPVLMPWLLFGVGAIVFAVLGRRLALSQASIGALILVCGLGNTSFVGLPMIESLHGRDGLGLGLLIDQFGSYLVLSTIGIFVVTLYAAQARPSPRAMVTKILTFPPLIGVAVALALRPVAFPIELDAALARLGDMLAPLALLSVGLQLRLNALREQRPALCLGLGFKLLVCPAIVLTIVLARGGQSGMAAHVSLIEAAMPPMIGAGIVATQADLNPHLVSTLIGIGIPIGLLVAPLWSWGLGLLS